MPARVNTATCAPGASKTPTSATASPAAGGFICVSMPFVNTAAECNALHWWGDVAATVDYCRQTVLDVCERYRRRPLGGNTGGLQPGRDRLQLHSGYSDDEIADLWAGLHRPAVTTTACATGPYPESDVDSAHRRLRRIKRPAPRSSARRSRYLPVSCSKCPAVTAPFEFHTPPSAQPLRRVGVARDIAERRVLSRRLAIRRHQDPPGHGPHLRTSYQCRGPRHTRRAGEHRIHPRRHDGRHRTLRAAGNLRRTTAGAGSPHRRPWARRIAFGSAWTGPRPATWTSGSPEACTFLAAAVPSLYCFACGLIGVSASSRKRYRSILCS